VARFSGGEQQMLSVARRTDEPAEADADGRAVARPRAARRREIFGIIAELHKDGTTIFLVEQNAHMALKVAHHFYLIEQGRITFSGDPGSLAEDEVIHRAYLGSAKA
jgi:branched-chain amino acid transport system ATP-binding protein